MEIMGFYSLNILVGAVLAIVLGLYGAHVVARQKTMEVVLLGQTIQVGILLGVIANSIVFSDHDDHGLHLEIIVSVVFTILLMSLYGYLTSSRQSIKTPVLVLFYTVLLSISYLIVAASPLVESHMVKAFLGDIVTASKAELNLILLLAMGSLVFFWIKRKLILEQSFDLSLFSHLVTSQGRNLYLIFNALVLCLMIYSIHVLGIVFTLCMMILPITMIQFVKSSIRELYMTIIFMAPISVLMGFILNISFDQFPTSSLITISFLILAIVFIKIRSYR